MGGTRGIARDDLNMQYILSYISHLSHLVAVYILLKPDESKLNTILRFYLDQLIDFLGKNVRGNIVFSVTNTRSTFYTSCDTGSSLKSLLESYSFDEIRFQK